MRLGAPLDALDNGRATPLHSAAGKGHVKVLRCLKELGGNLYARADCGRNALHTAAAYGQRDSVRRRPSDTHSCRYLVLHEPRSEITKEIARTVSHKSAVVGSSGHTAASRPPAPSQMKSTVGSPLHLSTSTPPSEGRLQNACYCA